MDKFGDCFEPAVGHQGSRDACCFVPARSNTPISARGKMYVKLIIFHLNFDVFCVQFFARIPVTFFWRFWLFGELKYRDLIKLLEEFVLE